MSDAVLGAIVHISSYMGLGASGIIIVMTLVGIAVFAGPGWLLLQIFGKRYRQKKFSDQSITLDSIWLLFAVVQSIGLAFEGGPWILSSLLAFAVYKVVAVVGLKAASASFVGTKANTLLLLRVFALSKRSERLFDKLRIHWQYTGNITMIAGPDLVTSTVQPNEFLEFVSGRLSRQFVRDHRDLETRAGEVDTLRDPDSRFRISEFLCYNNTWQMTIARLVEDCEVVLMDLRSFSPANQGCIFELGRLVDSVDIDCVVLLVDRTTDRGFLESTLTGLWQGMSKDSPNQTASSPKISIVQIERQTESEIRRLVGLLMESPGIRSQVC